MARQSKGTAPQAADVHHELKQAFCAWDGNVLVLNVLGTPAAKRDVIGKPKGNQLKISVTAAPEDGKATDHMVRFLAKAFGVAVRDIEVVFGRTSIHKQLRIQSPQHLPPVIAKTLAGEGAETQEACA
ncbi:MAG: DUF167 family protein [Halothiobacillaceae bacterium]|nr:DUF167 family protein [Halothiobacillaceae bacterium]